MEKKYTFKRIILLEFCILFLASSFPSDKNPGWVVQSIPVNKLITDIFFLDSLKGWAVTEYAPQYDTAYILSTTNGGTNWNKQFQGHFSLNAVQFVDSNVGYAVGGDGFVKMFKTTNGGNNWNTILSGIGKYFYDVFFVNKDTGWVCDNDNLFGIGLIKTTNGGQNWFQQLGAAYGPSKLFFINKDTGWCVSSNIYLYRTINSGQNWNLQFTSAADIEAIFFLTPLKGWMRGGPNIGTNGISYTTNGGFNWNNTNGEVGGFDIKFVNDSIGYTGRNSFRVVKSKDGGKNWGYQPVPIQYTMQVSVLRNDTNLVWAGGVPIVHTTDGGGPITQIINYNEQIAKDFKLYQNFPNPFNPNTVISYSLLKNCNVVLKVYDILGKEIVTLVNKNQKAGKYEVQFSNNRYTNNQLQSGVYFYSLFVDGVNVDTKKAVLLK